MSHHIDLVIEDGEVRAKFRCTGTLDAPCRRRPPDWRERESWTHEEATESGFDCWAVDWVEWVGMEDGVLGEDQVLASARVSVVYDEGVQIDLDPLDAACLLPRLEPTYEDAEPEPIEGDGS